MSNALGNSVIALYNCDDYIRFLDKKERNKFRKYKKEMDSVDDLSSSDFDKLERRCFQFNRWYSIT